MIEKAASRQTLLSFLKQAESSWFTVYDSSSDARQSVTGSSSDGLGRREPHVKFVRPRGEP